MCTKMIWLLLAAVALSAQANVDPEIRMTVPEIIKHWGYPVEEINATTEDGYILTIHRIPHGKSGPSKKRPVIFLQHGLEDSSATWLVNLPSQSAGFFFADAGFDVWIGNMRGNTYSRGHVRLSPKSADYWRFSFDEMAKYDLPAMINKALKVTGQKDLYYAGHSQGTLTMFSLLSHNPNFHKKIRTFFALAPVAHVKYIKGLYAMMAHLLYDEIDYVYRWIGDSEFVPSGILIKLIAEYGCTSVTGAKICDSILKHIMGVDSNQQNVTRTPVYMSHYLAGSSTLNVLHWFQMVRSGVLAKYNYGTATRNQKHYNATQPPVYDLAKVSSEMHLFWSSKDWLATKKDIQEYLFLTLKKQYVVKTHQLDEFNHSDFVWGVHAAEKVYTPMLKAMREDLAKRRKH